MIDNSSTELVKHSEAFENNNCKLNFHSDVKSDPEFHPENAIQVQPHFLRCKINPPREYIEMLINASATSLEKLSHGLNDLVTSLKNNDLSWIEEFQKKGLSTLIVILNKFYHKTDGDVIRGAKIHLDCLKCIKLLMTRRCQSSYALQKVCREPWIITALCNSLDYNLPYILIEILDILTMISITPIGHHLILQAFEKMNVDNDEAFKRFQFIANLLKITNNDNLVISSFTFINAMINSPHTLNTRLALRNEFLRAGLRDILEDIEKGRFKYNTKEIYYQLKIFHENREKDADRNFQKFDNLRFQFSDIDECYDLVKGSVSGTQAEILLKSIFQHLLFIRDEPNVRIAHYRLIEECVSQIVLHHNGCDPDFRPARKVNVYVVPEIGIIPHNEDDSNLDRLKEILLSKHLYENKISSLEAELEKCKTKGRQETSDASVLDTKSGNSDGQRSKPVNGKLLSSLRFTSKYNKKIIVSPLTSAVGSKSNVTNASSSRIPTFKWQGSKEKVLEERVNKVNSKDRPTSKKVNNERTIEKSKTPQRFNDDTRNSFPRKRTNSTTR